MIRDMFYYQFLVLCLLICALHIKVILCWAHKYLWILYPLLGLTLLSLCIALLYLIFFTVFVLRYILSDMSNAISFLLMSTFMEKSFSYFTFSLNVSLKLKGVSCRKYMYGPCLFIHSDTIYLSIGTFHLFTFKVVFSQYTFIAI